MTCDSCFTILVEVLMNHILAETQVSQIIQGEQNTRLWPEILQTSTKLLNNIILKTFLSIIFFIIQVLIKQRFRKHHLLQSRKQQNDKMRQLTI